MSPSPSLSFFPLLRGQLAVVYTPRHKDKNNPQTNQIVCGLFYFCGQISFYSLNNNGMAIHTYDPQDKLGLIKAVAQGETEVNNLEASLIRHYTSVSSTLLGLITVFGGDTWLSHAPLWTRLLCTLFLLSSALFGAVYSIRLLQISRTLQEKIREQAKEVHEYGCLLQGPDKLFSHEHRGMLFELSATLCPITLVLGLLSLGIGIVLSYSL